MDEAPAPLVQQGRFYAFEPAGVGNNYPPLREYYERLHFCVRECAALSCPWIAGYLHRYTHALLYR